MLRLKSRKKTLVFILMLWLAIFATVFVLAKNLYESGFKKLELNYAKESNYRAYQAMLSHLKHIYFLNIDYAYWDATYEFINNQNKNYEEKNLVDDLFIDNQMNFVFLMNKTNMIWGKSFDLENKKFYPYSFKDWNKLFVKIPHLVTNRQNINDVSRGTHGFAGFYKLNHEKKIIYLAVNDVFDSNKTKPTNGYLIFAKTLNNLFFDDLSKAINYPTQLYSVAKFLSLDEKHQDIFKKNIVNDKVYIQTLNKQFLRSYRALKDINGNIIGVLSVDLSRDLYLESEAASRQNQIIILTVSLFAIFFMISLIYLFFAQQDKITKAFEQFFPRQFIELLDKEDVLSVALGDHIEKTITVLFLDIRNFTTISEGMSPSDNFKFINQVLEQIAPIVTKNNGFIDKYIGDAIMALFPSSTSHANDAINTALKMLEKLEVINKNRRENNQFEVHIGIGINTGQLMLGIIGTEGRIEATVVSDVVNTASRIESATKTYQQSLLISENTLKFIKNKEQYQIDFVDNLMAKGKSKEVPVYSVHEK